MKKRGSVICLLVLLLMSLFSVPVSALNDSRGVEVESEAIGEDWQHFLDTIPDEVRDVLPESFFSGDMALVGEGVREAGAFSAILRVIGRLTGVAIKQNLALLSSIAGVLVLAATLGAFFEKKSSVSRTFDFVVCLTTAILIFALSATRFDEIRAYFDTVSALCVAILPLMGMLYAMGGNVGAAVANHSVMSAFLVVLEKVFAASVVPVASLCLLLALLK